MKPHRMANVIIYVIVRVLKGRGKRRKAFVFNWLPPRDSNPDMLIQSQLSYH